MCEGERVGYEKNLGSDPERPIRRWTHSRASALGEHKGELVIASGGS